MLDADDKYVSILAHKEGSCFCNFMREFFEPCSSGEYNTIFSQSTTGKITCMFLSFYFIPKSRHAFPVECSEFFSLIESIGMTR